MTKLIATRIVEQAEDPELSVNDWENLIRVHGAKPNANWEYISGYFVWAKTQEGQAFWQNVYKKLKTGTGYHLTEEDYLQLALVSFDQDFTDGL